MIDTDKYEGHAPAPWSCDQATETSMDISGPSGHWLARVEYHSRNSVYLMADAPLLLAEVKRLRGLLTQSYDELSLATRWVERYFESKGRSCADVAQAVENLEKFIEEGGEE